MQARPRERRQARNRDAIVQAARELIAERGVGNVSLRQIAARADYSPAALYEYFSSKEELIAELARRAEATFRRSLGEGLEGTDPKGAIRSLGRAYGRWAREHPEDFRLIFGELRTERARPEAAGEKPSGFDLLLDLVAELFARNEVSPHLGLSPVDVAYMVWALVHGQAMLRLGHLRALDYDFERIDDLALERLLAGLA